LKNIPKHRFWFL